MMEQIAPSPNHHADFMISHALAVVVRYYGLDKSGTFRMSPHALMIVRISTDTEQKR